MKPLYGSRLLTPRERDIVRLVAEGMRAEDIAAALHLSWQYVKKRLKEIFNKTGMSNRVELAIWWVHQEEKQNETRKS